MDKLHQGQEKVSYSVPEVAIIMGITNYRVRMMVKLKQMRAILAGKQLLIMNTELQRILNKNG
mgnify:FL=1|tara:strand:- start:10222 stop:10410 length:189 start_codon:yes stop_codon:yes gene_type:complete